ncbi:gamma-secretase subunit PEN-2 [Ixodes scapularis]|uniref:Gamma-secretase subunit PEN-2 n=2 Tax=Ixodes TaxID=6944 RepID=B7P979_IXOSC|nr:gamma-secretase subunit PEN-2 [Ixodes scapularis]EEC03151.1 membrane protein, putative [Ixodes scapularis]|eukprot:XP_002403735.1 membrane protein, putative [Ixodes scapularis]
MDLAKVKDDEKLRLCRWYYRGGFFILPFLWFVNAVWFFKEAFVRPPFDEQKTIRGYVIKSGIGATVWFVALVVWVVFFQLKRAEWGATGDYLSFITPTGIP